VVLVLDEPARRGPDDGRAVGRLGKTAAGAAYPGGETGLTADQVTIRILEARTWKINGLFELEIKL